MVKPSQQKEGAKKKNIKKYKKKKFEEIPLCQNRLSLTLVSLSFGLTVIRWNSMSNEIR